MYTDTDEPYARAYADKVGTYHTRKLAFDRLHADLIGQIARGNADAAYYIVRLLSKLAMVNN